MVEITKSKLISRIYGAELANSRKRGHDKPAYIGDELKKWLFEKPKFHTLFQKYKESGFEKKYVPSIHRTDNSLGYTFDNIELMTWEEHTKTEAFYSSFKNIAIFDKNWQLLKIVPIKKATDLLKKTPKEIADNCGTFLLIEDVYLEVF